MIRMQCLIRYRHNGVLYKPGESFEVDSDYDARELTAVGFARRADVAAVEKPRESPKTGAYDRRDLRARDR